MPVLVTLSVLAAVAWGYLLVGHGGFWRTDCRLPPAGRQTGLAAVGRATAYPALADPAPAGAALAGPGPGEAAPGASGPACADPVPDEPAPADLANTALAPAEAGPADPVAADVGGAVAADAPPSGSSRQVTSRVAVGRAGWPAVVAVVPARDEAAILPETLPSLLAQEYPGDFAVVLVDDASGDGTGEVAAALGRGRRMRVVEASPPPEGWAGKVWAMAQGAAAAGECDYLLFTDADIAFAPGSVTALVEAAVADDRALVSQMALLRAETGWERWIVPAFVYFFAKLYPFRRVARPRSRTAAAAGGCMLVRRQALAAAGGLAGIAGARIDDVALARLLKRGPGRARCWLGWTTQVHSRRPYPRLAELWDMVARSAYTQLRYSPALLAGTVAGLVWLYLLPPAAALGGLAALAAGAGPAWAAVAAAGLAGWAIMALSYLPVLRLYRLSPLRAPALPLVALLYTAMTVDSARRHRAGRGGEWKGRAISSARRVS